MAMSKKDYERAARIVQRVRAGYDEETASVTCAAFVELFALDNPRFDAERFEAACVPGANVRARPAPSH